MSTITRPDTRRAPGKQKMSAEEFGRILDAGVYEGRHVELLDVELYEVTKNPPDNDAVNAPGRGHCASLLPRAGLLRCGRRSRSSPGRIWWPEHDIRRASVGPPRDTARDLIPSTADVAIGRRGLRELAQDWSVKLSGYCAGGVPRVLDPRPGRRLRSTPIRTAASISTWSVVRQMESVELGARRPAESAGTPLLTSSPADAAPAEEVMAFVTGQSDAKPYSRNGSSILRGRPMSMTATSPV